MKKYVGITDLTEAYATKYNVTKKEAEQAIKNVLEVMEEELLKEDYRGLQFINFFTLEKVVRKARKGRNPRNPEHEIFIPERLALKVKVGKALHEKLNS